ncbi:kunitz trypsin inhibitor 5-like [Mangifera indica]|uniref:kunitz trypsin inhibitor 5-like n=1 Tax=Mangifera indica TaxID=29780 RepID=UPI001CF93E31|nr:kunitz trypsin inhibitor 5-like [Mangifera indica]
MKSPLLQLSLLFFAFIEKQYLSATTTPVLDFTGKKVLSGTEYYILSTFQDSKNCVGLNLSDGTTKTCPMNVIQENLEFQKGVALTFLHVVDQEDGVVYESLDLNIKFSSVKIACGQPTAWRVGDFENSTGQWFITADGVEGDPGARTLESWFRFEKNSENTYKIRHCPSVCRSCVTLCSDVGVYSGDGLKRLALSQTPMAITFIKGK